jgi:hypothetical protein
VKSLLSILALFAGQAVLMQSKPVIHLRPHIDIIDAAWHGDLLELDHSPQVIYLPRYPPKADVQGNLWSLDIKNFGPLPVTVTANVQFSVTINTNQTVHVYSNGTGYFLKAH